MHTAITTKINFALRAGILVIISVVLAVSAVADPKKTLQKAQKALRAGDFERAEKLYREVLQKDKKDVAARLGVSKPFLKQRRLSEAFEEAAYVRNMNPHQRPRTHCWDRQSWPPEFFR